jgi:uncharacterized protein YidB (DUF937 family)
MARGFPSMTALLGLLAIAGYQNRDKIAEFLRGGAQRLPSGAPGQGGQGGMDGLLAGLGGASVGSVLSGGLGELVNRFRQSGDAETADSWVKRGPNRPCTPAQLERALGPEAMDNLQKHTGLTRDELLFRLCRELPNAVDKYTPEGHLPTETELSRA